MNMFDDARSCQVILPITINPIEGNPHPHLDMVECRGGTDRFSMDCDKVISITSVGGPSIKGKDIPYYIEDYWDAFLIARFRRLFYKSYLEEVKSSFQISDVMSNKTRHNLVETGVVKGQDASFYLLVYKQNCTSSTKFFDSLVFKNMKHKSVIIYEE